MVNKGSCLKGHFRGLYRHLRTLEGTIAGSGNVLNNAFFEPESLYRLRT